MFAECDRNRKKTDGTLLELNIFSIAVRVGHQFFLALGTSRDCSCLFSRDNV